MTAPARAQLPRLPFVLLGLMTLFTFGGPVAIGYALRGGSSRDWPPDRPVEWFVLGAVSGMVLVLMVACLALALKNRPTTPRQDKPSRREGDS